MPFDCQHFASIKASQHAYNHTREIKQTWSFHCFSLSPFSNSSLIIYFLDFVKIEFQLDFIPFWNINTIPILSTTLKNLKTQKDCLLAQLCVCLTYFDPVEVSTLNVRMCMSVGMNWKRVRKLKILVRKAEYFIHFQVV